MEIDNPLYCPSRLEWRKWLEQNHAKEKEVWILRYRKDSGKPSVSYNDAVEEALCFGWIDGKVKGIDSEKSGLRFSPRKARSSWSKINKDKAEKMIKEGKMTAAGLVKIEEAKKSGAWVNAYVLREAQDIPDDLKEALAGNKEAWNNFQSFAPSHRNAYIYWLNDAKTPETRQRRIAEVVTRSAMPKQPRPEPGEKWWQVRR